MNRNNSNWSNTCVVVCSWVEGDKLMAGYFAYIFLEKVEITFCLIRSNSRCWCRKAIAYHHITTTIFYAESETRATVTHVVGICPVIGGLPVWVPAPSILVVVPPVYGSLTSANLVPCHHQHECVSEWLKVVKSALWSSG